MNCEDGTILKSHIAVEYLSVPALHISTVYRDSTCEEVDVCAGSVGLIQLQCC